MNTIEENAIFRVSSKDTYNTWEEFERRWTNLYRYLREHHSNLFNDVANHTHANESGGGSVDHVDLANKGTNTHAQIDTHIGDASDPHSNNMTVSYRLGVGSANAPAYALDVTGISCLRNDQYFIIGSAPYFGTYDAFDLNIGSGGTTLLALKNATGQIYISYDCSANSFTDRTPFYEGDAITELKAISGVDGKIDHSTLPEFAQSKDGKGRDLGAMISMLTVAIKQLAVRVEALELRGK